MRALLRPLLRRLRRWFSADDAAQVRPRLVINDGLSADLASWSKAFMSIPGMVSLEDGVLLYLLAYANPLPGDIVEIGCWQGRSTCFLARACKDTGNGIVRAIDHFKGNVGKEACFVVGRCDLSDLEANFRGNVERAGLDDRVRLYNMSSSNAVERYPKDFLNLRMLFIDGDHRYECVREDIEYFSPALQPGGLMVLHDYHPDWPGVIRAARDLVLCDPGYGGSLVLGSALIARKVAS